VARAGAASTKSRRFRTAGWAGRGERDGKVYARNVRHEALIVRMGVEDLDLPAVAAAG
jgi:hypothetical protein